MRPSPPRPHTPVGGGWTTDLAGTATIALILALGAATTAMWTAAQLASFVSTDQVLTIGLADSGQALVRLRSHLGDPAAAWPPGIASQLPGPVVYWPCMIVTVAVVAAAGWVWRRWRRHARGSGPLGVTASAGFARSRDLAGLTVAAPEPGRLTLGYAGRRLIAAEAQTSLAVVGPTGCGKTAGFAIPALLEWEGPVIATSVKNDLLGPTLKRRLELGKVWIYDPTAKSGKPANRWTPLASCTTWPGAMRIAAWLCEAAQPRMDTVTDGDYWYTQARKALAPYLYAAAVSQRTMSDVVRWIDAQELDEVKAVLKRVGGMNPVLARLRQTPKALGRREQLRPQIETLLAAAVREGVSLLPGGRNVRSWQQQPPSRWPLEQQTQLAEMINTRLDDTLDRELEAKAIAELKGGGTIDSLIAALSLWQKEERLRGSVYATIENVLAGYADPGVGDASKQSDFTFEEWLSGSNTIFVSAPPHEQARLRPVLSVLLQQAIRTAYETANTEGGKLKRPCLVLLDEAGNITPLRDLPTYASTARSHGITFVSIWQDLSQMRAIYRDRAQTVLNNHQAKLFGTGQSDDATLEYLSRLVGDERRTDINLSGDLWGSRRNVSEHTNYRRAAPADVIRRLHENEAVLIYGNRLPVHVRLRPWYRSTTYLTRRRSDPPDRASMKRSIAAVAFQTTAAWMRRAVACSGVAGRLFAERRRGAPYFRARRVGGDRGSWKSRASSPSSVGSCCAVERAGQGVVARAVRRRRRV